MSRSFRNALSALLVGLGCVAGPAQAGPYSDLFVFGDSLTDTGNVLALTTAFQPPAFPNFLGAPGRFSNGPVWIETLASGLGLASAAAPSNRLTVPVDASDLSKGFVPIPIGASTGHNFAFGGARTLFDGSAGPTTGLQAQLVAWNGTVYHPGDPLTRLADPNALYVVLAGANDLRDIRSANFGSLPSDVAGRATAALGIAGNVVNAVGALAQQGARHFLVSNLPDLGKTPEAFFLENNPGQPKPGLMAASTDVTLAFNGALHAGMVQLDSFFDVNFSIDLDIEEMDFHGLFESVIVNPAAYGVTNTSAPCINPVAPTVYFAPGSSDINCNVSLFSDPLHPSALAHRFIGELALATVPEPQSIVLVAMAGLMLLLVPLRRRT